MPQSILPVAFDLAASQLTASQITAKTQAGKSLHATDDVSPRESFADYLQRTQEKPNPVKQKSPSRKTLDDRTQSANNDHAQNSKSVVNSKTTVQKTNPSKTSESDVVSHAVSPVTAKDDTSEKISGETIDSSEQSLSLQTEEYIEDPIITDESQVVIANLTSQQDLSDTTETTESDFFLLPVSSEASTEISVMSDIQIEEKILQQISEPTLVTGEMDQVTNDLSNQNNTDPVNIATFTDLLSLQKATTSQDAIVASETPVLDPTLLAVDAKLQPTPVINLQSAVPGDSNTSSNRSRSALDTFNLSANSGTDLPLDELVLLSENDSIETESSIEDLGELFFKGDEKNNKTEQFKLLMGQSIAKEQVIPLEKPTANPLIQAGLQSAANELAPASRLFVPQAQLGMSAGHPQWGKAVGEKILWMASQQLSSADIRLDPPELGSLQVKVTVQQDQASITFISPHPQVRELLDQQAIRLRELFADQGLNLSHVDIADRHQQSSGDSQGNSQSSRHFASEESDEELMQTSVSSLYLVDLHA